MAGVILAVALCAVVFMWWQGRRQLQRLQASHEIAIGQLQKLHTSKEQLERALQRETQMEGEPARNPVFLANDQVGIEYLAHACFRIYSPDAIRIVIDPWGSNVDSILKDPIDAILITHPHWDHDAGESSGRYVNWPSEAQIIRDPGHYVIGDVQVEGIEGRHAAGMGKSFNQKNTMFLLEIAGVRIVHLGDNQLPSNRQMNALGRVDILMIPIDAHEHLLKHHEVDAIRRRLEPQILVPMHYRHPKLHRSSASPLAPGPIDPWLDGKENVRRLDRNTAAFSLASLPAERRIMVFQVSPIVEKNMVRAD